jgi:GNAT superfamily N-acetyltransferase
MQSSTFDAQVTDWCLSTDVISPRDFVKACWEAHPAIRGELEQYFSGVLAEARGQLFGVFSAEGDLMGRGMVEIHPGYVSRGFPCATFGWLDGHSPEVIRQLLDAATEWASRQQVVRNGRLRRNALLRGPISFPKEIGGVGCQVDGFDQPRMFVISTNRPQLAEWVAQAGFTPDAYYACADVSQTPEWDKATAGEADFNLVTLTEAEWREREEEAMALCGAAFGTFLPDTAAEGRFRQSLDATSLLGDPIYSWPAALDRNGNLVGFIACLPNLYEMWGGKPVTSVNVDTVVIAPSQRGKGLFSALHDKGYVDQHGHRGIEVFEGTAIWEANENAVKSIFPHGTITRRHVVFQKRLKKD